MGSEQIAAKRVLVTGGAGFIGSNLCDRLLADGHHVVCLDNFVTGIRRNVRHLVDNPRFTLVEHDVTNPVSVTADAIYNLACPASPRHYQNDPIGTFKTCVLGAVNVLELAQRSGARVLQASTSEVYGDGTVHPQAEGYWGHVNPIGVRSCYDEGKRSAESLFFDFHRRHGTDIKVARIFNTYGPRMRTDDGRVVSNFVVQALKGEPISIYGDGSHTRSFCYVDDLVDGLVRLMDSPAGITGPFNLGNPEEFTVLELAERVLRLTRSQSRLVRMPLPEDDPRRRRPDVSRARTALGWMPHVGVEDGLRRTIEYFRSELGTTRSAPVQLRVVVPRNPVRVRGRAHGK